MCRDSRLATYAAAKTVSNVTYSAADSLQAAMLPARRDMSLAIQIYLSIIAKL
ncbi:MAG: hypothetical protein ACI8Z1_002314 [Candidatus Azotimanducaceae bacterium]|jgi:hypothetical protein